MRKGCAVLKVNAVFEGGGVKAIGLVGAVKASEDYGLSFGRVAGTSSGAIVASLLAAGYRADEIREIIVTTPFSNFLQKGVLHRIVVVGPLLRMFIMKGLYSGDELEKWISGLLQAKGLRTFGDLPPGTLRIVASDITQGKMLVLPDDIAHYGFEPSAFPVAKAVRMSTSIPFFFDPVLLRLAQPLGSQWMPKPSVFVVDGALLSNFPLWLFDREQQGESIIPTIGYQLVGKNEHAPRQIRGPVTMMQAIVATMLEAHDERYIEQHNRYRTIKVPTLGVSTTEFDISTERSLELFDAGYKAAKEYLGNWSPKMYLLEYDKYAKKRI